jgi:hypothetical protein
MELKFFSSTGTLASAIFANRNYASSVRTDYKTVQAGVPVLQKPNWPAGGRRSTRPGSPDR